MRVNRKLLVREIANGTPLKDVVNRGTGRTTAAVLGAMQVAIQAPGQEIPIRDDSTPRTQAGARFLRGVALDFIGKLGLDGFAVQTTLEGDVILKNNYTESLNA